MGHRASYAIRENREVRIFYAHWGAMTIAEDLYWGPDGAEAFIQSNEAASKFLDRLFGEGGIVLDKDLRHATWFAWDWPEDPDVNQVYGDLLAERWRQSGWTINRVADWFELAGAAGIARREVLPLAFPPTPAGLGTIGANSSEGTCEGILSVADRGEWRDHAIGFSMPAVLVHGPALLEALAAFPGVDGAPPDKIRSFAAVDPHSRTIRIELSAALDSIDGQESIPFLAASWPGWTLTEAIGGISAHFAFTGRPVPEHLIPPPIEPAGPSRTEGECMKLIAERLAGTDDRKQFGVRAIGQILGELGAETKVEISRSAVTPTPESGPVPDGPAGRGTEKDRKLWKN